MGYIKFVLTNLIPSTFSTLTGNTKVTKRKVRNISEDYAKIVNEITEDGEHNAYVVNTYIVFQCSDFRF